jgi:hypothetical protein
VKVGLGAKVNTFLAKFIPSLSDRMSAMQLDRQQYAEPPRAPEGTLRQPSNEGRVRGSGGREKPKTAQHHA